MTTTKTKTEEYKYNPAEKLLFAFRAAHIKK